MEVTFSGTFPKDPSSPDENEDCCCIDIGTSRFVLCDGASESFDSKTWATILAERFIAKPEITPEWVQEVVASYVSRYNVQELSYSKQASFERGSFATLLGVETHAAVNSIEIIAIGDSIALLVDEEANIIKKWPYSKAADFETPPTLLSTRNDLNSFVSESDFASRHRVLWSLSDFLPHTLLCMTDALGQWTLRMAEEDDDSWHKLLQVRHDSDLAEIVEQARTTKSIRTDDSTLLVIHFP
jgi:hypothetical protein